MYKLSYNISFAEWKRKWLLLLIINFCITPIEMLANYKIESSNYILRIASKDKGRLLLQNKQSETLVQLGELKLGQWPQLELKNNCKYEITEVNGASAIRIHYFFPPSVPTSMKLTGTFIVHQDRVDVQYLLSGVPEKYKADWKGCQFRFCLPENAGTQKLPEAKLGIWQRDAKGGLPLETADAKIFPFLIKKPITKSTQIGKARTTDIRFYLVKKTATISLSSQSYFLLMDGLTKLSVQNGRNVHLP